MFPHAKPKTSQFFIRPGVRGTKPAVEDMRVLAASFFAINLGDANPALIRRHATPSKFDCKRAARHWGSGDLLHPLFFGRRWRRQPWPDAAGPIVWADFYYKTNAASPRWI
jgi:hypothetical protein